MKTQTSIWFLNFIVCSNYCLFLIFFMFGIKHIRVHSWAVLFAEASLKNGPYFVQKYIQRIFLAFWNIKWIKESVFKICTGNNETATKKFLNLNSHFLKMAKYFTFFLILDLLSTLTCLNYLVTCKKVQLYVTIKIYSYVFVHKKP